MNEPAPNPSSPQRSLLARLFLSPDEPRLRAGWRLLLHFFFYFLLSGGLGFFALALGLLRLDRMGASLAAPSLINFTAIVLATLVARHLLDRRDLLSLGLRRDRYSLRDLAFGFALPGAMMGAIYLTFTALGWLHFEGWAWERLDPDLVLSGLLTALLVFILVGIAEELLSRGYHLQNLIEGTNLQIGLFLSSIIFALLHIGNPASSWTSTVGLIGAGYFLAYGWVRTRSLWMPIGLHIGWNVFEGPVFGFQVSGLETFRLITQSVHGPDLITGGAFGPEAGLIILPMMALGAWAIARYSKDRLSANA